MLTELTKKFFWKATGFNMVACNFPRFAANADVKGRLVTIGNGGKLPVKNNTS